MLGNIIDFLQWIAPRFRCELWSPLSCEEVGSRVKGSVTSSFYWFTNKDTPFSGTATPTGFKIGKHSWKDEPKPFMHGTIVQAQDRNGTHILISASYNVLDITVTLVLWPIIALVLIQKLNITDMPNLTLVCGGTIAAAFAWHRARLFFYWKQVDEIVSTLVSILEAEIGDCSHDRRQFPRPKVL